MRFFLFSVRPLLTPAQNYGILYKILCFQYMLFVSEYASPRITILMFFSAYAKHKLKKYAGLFRQLPNVANRIRLRRATSNAHVFNKISYAGLSKWSQRGGLENRLPKRHGGSNPSSCATSTLEKPSVFKGFLYLLCYIFLPKIPQKCTSNFFGTSKMAVF